MKSIFEQNGGTYTQVGDYLIPDISLPDAPAYPIGKYGRMRKAYLKEHHPGLYTQLILSGKLYEHLSEVERTCNDRLDIMIPQMAEAQGVTEALKVQDQLGWVGRMNEIKHSAEESILAEIIFE
ncbi:MAG: TnpV protein [Clostridia bacterium]|nr:TnpV protein [Clostridia bacterium]